jgi:hypothetical protein
MSLRSVIFNSGRQGVDRWDYTMVFDADYACVLSGAVTATVAGSEESHEQSRFGVSLIYLNAAVEQHFAELLVRDADVVGTGQGEEQGLRLALMPGLGLEPVLERAFEHFQGAGTPSSLTMRLLQLVPAAHATAAAQRVQDAGDGTESTPVEMAERLLYTEEAMEAIDEALAAEAEVTESRYETEGGGAGEQGGAGEVDEEGAED